MPLDLSVNVSQSDHEAITSERSSVGDGINTATEKVPECADLSGVSKTTVDTYQMETETSGSGGIVKDNRNVVVKTMIDNNNEIGYVPHYTPTPLVKLKEWRTRGDIL